MNEVKGNGETVIGKIRGRDDITYVRFTVKEAEGRKLLDIRRYFIDGKGDEYPSTKGVTFSQKNLLKVRQYIDDALRVMSGGQLFVDYEGAEERKTNAAP